MKKFSGLLIVFITSNLLTGCSVIEGIFKAGVWSGIIIVVVILALIIWLVSKFMGGGSNQS